MMLDRSFCSGCKQQQRAPANYKEITHRYKIEIS